MLFRLLRGSGLAGLRGMDVMSTRDGMTIARPLMELKKRDLIAFARARGAPFIDDPSNVDPRFARTRLRALLARLDEEGLSAEALDRLARRARETEAALAHLTAEVEAQVGSEGAIDARTLFAAPIAIAHRILARRIAEAGQRDATRIGLEKIETLAGDLRDALKERRAYGANVGGAMVRLSAKGRLAFAPRAAEGERQAVGCSRDPARRAETRRAVLAPLKPYTTARRAARRVFGGSIRCDGGLPRDVTACDSLVRTSIRLLILSLLPTTMRLARGKEELVMKASTMIRASAMALVVALAAAQPAHAALTLIAVGGGGGGVARRC